ncbi:MAG: amino acid ABC transporter substrate-binding protein, partial [Bacteroidetes bacterium]|nr:amino acid ABC transporter substrate-binding protein [Bacteroidota bacterium]
SAQEVTILVEDGHYAPLKFKDKDGKVTGIYPEIVKKAISRMPEYTVKFYEVPWARAKLYLKQGRYFAMLPPYFHAHDWLTDDEPKRPYIWPYSLPLFTQTDIVVCDAMKLKSPRPNWPEDYQDLSFAMQRGDGIAGEKFNKMFEQKKIKVYFVLSNLDAIKLVLQGRQDCTVIAKLPFYWLIKEMKENGEYEQLDKVVPLKEKTIRTNEGYLGYTDINAEKNFPYKKDFNIKFDIEIYKMKKSGEIQEIIKRFIEF